MGGHWVNWQQAPRVFMRNWLDFDEPWQAHGVARKVCLGDCLEVVGVVGHREGVLVGVDEGLQQDMAIKYEQQVGTVQAGLTTIREARQVRR